MADPYLSVIIPAYNEEKRIGRTLSEVSAYCDSWAKRTGHSYEVIVVDDGSRDQTANVSAQKLPTARVINLGRNFGKGRAVKTGMLQAQGEWRLFTDADNSTPISELDKFWPQAAAGADIIIGSRAMPESKVMVSQSWFRQTLGRLANLLIRAVAVKTIRDTQCGFKMFSAAAAARLFGRQKLDGWGFDFEILALAQAAGLVIAQVPVSWYNSQESQVRLLSGVWRTFVELLAIRFNLSLGRYK